MDNLFTCVNGMTEEEWRASVRAAIKERDEQHDAHETTCLHEGCQIIPRCGTIAKALVPTLLSCQTDDEVLTALAKFALNCMFLGYSLSENRKEKAA